MRILRLAVKSFRGLEAGEIAPAPRGVTVIEGPNEAGKSSLIEALGLLLESADSSTAREVRDVQPAGRDVGSEVEAEIESGPYRFTYFKRFHRDRETVLRLVAPKAEVLTGRQAHDRALEILRETVDLALWRALRVDQGLGMEQPDVASSPSLLAALDRVVGGEAAAGPETALIERVRKEVRRYLTERRGDATGELKEARREEEASRLEVEELEAQMAALEEDLAAQTELEKRRADLRRRQGSARLAADEARERWEQVEGLHEEVRQRQSHLAEEQSRLSRLRELAEADREERRLAADLQAADEEKTAAEEALSPLEAAAEGARSALEQAETEKERRLREARLSELVERREALRGDLERARALAVRLEELQGTLDGHRVTAEALAAVEDRQLELTRLEAAMEAGAPTLEVSALTAFRLPVASEGTGGSEDVPLEEGDRWRQQVTGRLHLRFADLAEVEVVPGEGVGQLQGRLAEARQELERSCRELGVSGPEEARRQARQRQALEVELQAAEQERQRLQTPESQLAAKLESLAGEIAELSVGMGGETEESADTADRETARQALASAEEGLGESKQRWEEASGVAREGQRRLESAQARHRSLDIERRAAHERSQRARQEIGQLAPFLAPQAAGVSQLALFRADLKAEELDESVQAVRVRAQQASASLEEAQRRLAAAQPDEARKAAEQAERQREELEGALRGAEDELTSLSSRLQVRGEAGLFDRLEEARGRLEAARRHLVSVEARAAAAERLLEVLSAARDRARETYSEPLRQRILALGRRVYGASFSVELDRELKVERRLLDGESLAFSQLSTGAREQLALIVRLACAELAAPHGGVPVILDDALGYSDEERLRAMAEVLEAVGEECQILVLTSVPDRYRHLRAETVLRLTPPPPRPPGGSRDPGDA